MGMGMGMGMGMNMKKQLTSIILKLATPGWLQRLYFPTVKVDKQERSYE